ncbi:MAG: hypothetical protein R3E83_19345 [Burkholderiaceae bacterium]
MPNVHDVDRWREGIRSEGIGAIVRERPYLDGQTGVAADFAIREYRQCEASAAKADSTTAATEAPRERIEALRREAQEMTALYKRVRRDREIRSGAFITASRWT